MAPQQEESTVFSLPPQFSPTQQHFTNHAEFGNRPQRPSAVRSAPETASTQRRREYRMRVELDDRLTDGASRLYSILDDMAGAKGYAWPRVSSARENQPTIASRIGKSPRQVWRCCCASFRRSGISGSGSANNAALCAFWAGNPLERLCLQGFQRPASRFQM